MIKKIKNKYLLLTALSFASFFLFVSEANAFWPIVTGSILRWLGISALIGFGIPLIEKGISIAIFLTIVGSIQTLAGNLIDSGIVLQNILLNPERTPVIQVIWETFRDFINIFFILILLVIAFSTIFNIETYKAKNLLPKLIIVALLINFSLVIAVWVIDLLWVPASVFISPLEQKGSVSGNLAETLKITELFKPLLSNILVIPKFITETGLRLALLVIKAFLTVWIALIIWARIIILLGLIMLSPLAWLGLTFPPIKEQTWGFWWKQIINWGSITVFLFGLIYFVSLFAQRLAAQFIETNPNIGRITFFPAGVEEQLFIIGLVVLGLFVGGLMYIRSLSGSLYDWTSLGFKKLWGWSGTGAKWVTKTTGVTGAASEVRKRMAEEGTVFGTEARKAREARIADRLAGLAGLTPTYAAQKNTLDQAEKASKDIDNRFKQARTPDEVNQIIAELRTKVEGGAKDPETLAAITTLAKKGELDVDLFNKAVDNFKDMPLAINRVFSEWKEGKFGGLAKAEDLLTILKDGRLGREAKALGYSFVASKDGSKVAEKMTLDDYSKGYQILGRNTKEGREFKKDIGKLKPSMVAQYNWAHRTEEFEPDKMPRDMADAVLKQIEGASAKDFAEYDKSVWDDPNFRTGLTKLLIEKKRQIPGSERKFKQELAKRFIREGKGKQLKTLNEVSPVSMKEVAMGEPPEETESEETTS